jgi:hypothetical protein
MTLDYPIRKRKKKAIKDVALNDGLHVGGIAMISPIHRKDWDYRLDSYFLNHQDIFTGRGSHIRQIAAELIRETPEKATDYTFKALKRGRVTFDDVWILPVSRDELPPKRHRVETTGDHPM